MKKLIAITFLAFSIISASMAQDKAADLKKLFELMNSEKMIDGIMNNMMTVMKSQAKSQIVGSDADKKLEKYFEFITTETKALSLKLINEDMVGIYDKHFTQSEIKDLIAFYESPTGKKLLEKTPDITKDLMNAMMTKHLPEFQEKMKKKLEEMK